MIKLLRRIMETLDDDLDEPLFLYVARPRRNRNRKLPTLHWKVKEKTLTLAQEQLLVERLHRAKSENYEKKPIESAKSSHMSDIDIKSLVDRLSTSQSRCKTTSTLSSEERKDIARKKLTSDDISNLVKRLAQHKERTINMQERKESKVLQDKEILELSDRLSRPKPIHLPPLKNQNAEKTMSHSEIESLSNRLATVGVKQVDSLEMKRRRERTYWLSWTASDTWYRLWLHSRPR